jgi:hypothetical protein
MTGVQTQPLLWGLKAQRQMQQLQQQLALPGAGQQQQEPPQVGQLEPCGMMGSGSD